jgi:hypothetical protein
MDDWKVRLSKFERLALGAAFIGGVGGMAIVAFQTRDPMFMVGILPGLVVY